MFVNKTSPKVFIAKVGNWQKFNRKADIAGSLLMFMSVFPMAKNSSNANSGNNMKFEEVDRLWCRILAWKLIFLMER